ncbi:MAG TPA: hypothetical protein VFO91_18400 [Anaerolineales bacterium]|nr:hypothetical protein [Anaerolineales bacterium]
MKTKISLISSLLLLALFGAACGGRSAAVDSGAGSVDDQASLVDALRAAGATVEAGDSVEQVFFAVKGQIIQVNGADVQVFEYETAEAMEAEAAQVSSDGGSIGTSMVTWVAAPHFYKSGRILVLYVGDDQAVLDLLEAALGPQFAGR